MIESWLLFKTDRVCDNFKMKNGLNFQFRLIPLPRVLMESRWKEEFLFFITGLQAIFIRCRNQSRHSQAIKWANGIVWQTFAVGAMRGKTRARFWLDDHETPKLRGRKIQLTNQFTDSGQTTNWLRFLGLHRLTKCQLTTTGFCSPLLKFSFAIIFYSESAT